MAIKRAAAQGIADTASNKKQKFSDQTNGELSEDLDLTVSDLRSLLAFSQEGGDNIRKNVRKFRLFLESIDETKDTAAVSRRQSTLLEYLREVVPLDDGARSYILSDFLQTWSFAFSSGNRALPPVITSTLALLLKVISRDLSFRKIGTTICQTLLKEDHVKVLKEGLSANRSQEQLLSASLRLITEIVAYDGGVCAKSIWRQRDVFFKRLDEFLTARPGSDENKKGIRTSGLRLNASKFLLANLRVQEPTIKGDILSDPKRVRAIFQNIADDSDSTIALVLRTLETYVLNDTNVSRQTKGRLLTESSLIKIASLYTHPDTSVRESIHEFLLKACCTPGAGALLGSDGWYKRSQKDISDTQTQSGPRFPAKYMTKATDEGPISITNNKLSNFLQELRPYANVQHRELVLAVFRAAPELVADYFHRRKNFSFDPKLTSTWIGFASLVIAVAQLPIPAFDASKGLPSVQIVLENILPASLSNKALTRCFNQSSALVRLLTAKLLIATSERLSRILQTAEQHSEASIYRAWKASVLSGFAERFPDCQSIVAAFRACTDEEKLLKESLLSALSSISTALPQALVQANFDVSLLLIDSLSDDQTAEPQIRYLNVDYLLQVAKLTEMDWFRKPERLQYSPFTTIFRLWVDNGGSQFEDLLWPILGDNFVLQQATKRSPLEALKLSIQQSQAIDALWEFVDNCLMRFMQKPLKYEGDLEEVQQSDEPTIVSLLTLVILEQWPHFVQAHFKEEVAAVACWIARWLNASSQIGESDHVLKVLQERLAYTTPAAALEQAVKINAVIFPDEISQSQSINVPSQSSGVSTHPEAPSTVSASLTNAFNARLSLPTHSDSYPELHRHLKKDLRDAIEESDLSSLLWCLCAPELNIRRQALSQLRNLGPRVQESDYAEKSQLYLLLMEVVETATQEDLLEPLPSLVAALAASMVDVLHDPSNLMYTKANRFLLKAPEWTSGKLPSYWISKVFYAPPTSESEGAGKREMEWLLSVLVDGLRTKADLDLYRRCRVFEHVMAKDVNLEKGSGVRAKVIDLLWRCTIVEGGALTLVTRFAVLSWLKGKMVEGDEDARWEALRRRILEPCDKTRLETWSAGKIGALTST